MDIFWMYTFTDKAAATRAIDPCYGDATFLKIVVSLACGENCMCSHPRTGDVTAEKLQKKSREIQCAEFFMTKYKLISIACARVATHAIFTAY